MHGRGLYEGRLGLDPGPPTPRADARPRCRRSWPSRTACRTTCAGGSAGARRSTLGVGRLPPAPDVGRLSLHLTWRAQAAGRETALPQVPRAGGDPGVTLTLRPVDALAATCDPWPFGGDEMALPVEARVVEDRPYASDADLQGALRAAPWETRAYRLSPPGT